MLIAKENVTRTLMILPSDVPGIVIESGEVARLPGLTFYDFEEVLEQPFWFTRDVERFLESREVSVSPRAAIYSVEDVPNGKV